MQIQTLSTAFASCSRPSPWASRLRMSGQDSERAHAPCCPGRKFLLGFDIFAART
jgi:hypothetical protein